MQEYHFMREVAAMLCPPGHYKRIILDFLILKSVSQNIYEKVIYILSYPLLLLYLYLCLQFSFLIPVHYFYTFCICVCFLTTKNLSNTCQQFKCFLWELFQLGQNVLECQWDVFCVFCFIFPCIKHAKCELFVSVHVLDFLNYQLTRSLKMA